MIDISAVGTTITFGSSSLSSVTFSDASDIGSPLEFGSIDPLGYEFDLNHEMSVYHKQVTPEFSIGFIPGSASDRKMRALLLSSMIGKGSISDPSDIKIDYVRFDFRSETGLDSYTLRDGYLVGGSVALGVSGDGRKTSAPYRFVFKTVVGEGGSSGSSFIPATGIYKDGSEIKGLYYARVSSSVAAKLISHPVETGAPIFDQKYLEPERVTVDVKIPMSIADNVVSTFFGMLRDRKIGSSWGGQKTPYSVSTKTEEYENLSLVSITHDETPDQFDLIGYSLQFQEILFSDAQGYRQTLDPGNHDAPPTQARGLQNAKPTA